MSLKFNLKCDEYHSNWSESLSNLRRETVFADVTLVCDDKVKLQSHKIILSSFSDTFKFILKENTHTHPLIYLSGVNSVYLGFILDFIYNGEINLHQEQLESFLEVAGKLEVVGLQGYNKGEECDETIMKISKFEKKSKIQEEEDLVEYQQDEVEDTLVEEVKSEATLEAKRQNSRTNTIKFERIDVSSMTTEEIEDKILGFCQKVDGVWMCQACKEYSHVKRNKVRRHIEAHIDGLSYTCTFCFKDFRTKNSLDNHSSLNHRNN